MQSFEPAPFGRRAEIIEAIRTELPGVVLENAGDVWLNMRYNSVPYNCPPKGVAINPATNRPQDYDGTITIRDFFRADPRRVRAHMRDVARGKRKATDPLPAANIKTADAAAIATSLLRRFEKFGLFHVTGNHQVDVQRRSAAKKLALTQKIERAERLLDSYWKRAEAFNADPKNKGRNLLMSKTERDAMEYLDSRPEDALEEGKILCPGDNGKCPFWSFEEETLAKHQLKRHPELPPREFIPKPAQVVGEQVEA